MGKCKCETVKRYDDYWQCLRGDCRRKFMPSDMIPEIFEQGMKDKKAQASVMGDLLIVVMPVPEEMKDD